MQELSIESLEVIDGGVNWAKVAMGSFAVVGGVATAATTSWSGVGCVSGGLVAIGGVGVIVRGFEDD